MKYLPSIYVEPIFFILSISLTIISLMQPQAEIDKMEPICDDDVAYGRPWDWTISSRNYCVNLMWANFQTLMDLIALPTLLVSSLLWSAYSDRTGRQQPMLIAIFSIVMSVLGWVLVLSPSLGWSLWNKLPFALVSGFTGGIGLFTVAAYAFMADVIKNKETLTVRLSILSVMLPICNYIVATPTASIMDSLSPISFSRSMIIVLALLILAFVYILARIPQVAPITLTLKEQQNHPACVSNDLENQFESDSSCSVFTPCAMFRDIWRAFVKQREGRVRLLVWLMCLLTFIAALTPSALQGGDDTFQRWSLFMNVDYADLTTYATIGFIITTIGTIIGSVVFKKVLHLCDTTVMLISLASTILAHLILIFAGRYHFVLLYVVNILSVFSGLQMPTGYAYLAKLVPKQELGRIFALLPIFAGLGGIVNGFLVQPMFIQTIDTFVSLIWVVAVALYIICFVLMLVIHVFSKRANLEKTLPALCDTREC